MRRIADKGSCAKLALDAGVAGVASRRDRDGTPAQNGVFGVEKVERRVASAKQLERERAEFEAQLARDKAEFEADLALRKMEMQRDIEGQKLSQNRAGGQLDQ